MSFCFAFQLFTPFKFDPPANKNSIHLDMIAKLILNHSPSFNTPSNHYIGINYPKHPKNHCCIPYYMTTVGFEKETKQPMSRLTVNLYSHIFNM